MTEAKVINSPASRMCAHVDCLPGRQTGSQSGFIDKPISSQTAPARVRTREGHAAIRNPKAYFKAWREAKFGGDFDPVRVAVDEAVAAFSSGKSAEGQESDRRIWLKIANRVGFENFLDALDQKKSELRNDNPHGKRVIAPSSAFQKLLNTRFPKKGGAR